MMKIVNGKLQPRSEENAICWRRGLAYEVQEYIMGSVWWPLIESEALAAERMRLENVLWAVDRMPAAAERFPHELPYLYKVALTGDRQGE